MSNNVNVPRLCGGTFFFQLLRMRKPTTRKKRDGLYGVKDPVNNQRVLEALIQFFYPNFRVYSDDTFCGDVSDYKSCKETCGDNLPFDESRTDFTAFDTLVRNNYPKVDSLMVRFVDKYINVDEPEKIYSVVRALLQVIKDDRTILPEDALYIDEAGVPVTKAQIETLDNIVLEPFLLGLWHFILLNRDNNLIGRDTIKAWSKLKGEKGDKWTYISNVGKDYPIDVKIRRLKSTEYIDADPYEDIHDNEIDEPIEEDEPEEYTSIPNTEPEFLEYRALIHNTYHQTINIWNNAPGGTQIAELHGNLTIGSKK